MAVKITVDSWGSRLKSSLMGFVVGPILALAAFPVLWSNEGCAVQTAKSLDEGAGAVVSVSADSVDAGNEGKLVHFSGTATTDETLRDDIFPVNSAAIRFERTVEMYQWKEHESKETQKKVGGSTETKTTYTYSKDWASSAVRSQDFYEQEGHHNPAAMPYEGRAIAASHVKVGAFDLPDTLVKQMTNWEPLQLEQSVPAQLDAGLRQRVDLMSGGLFIRGVGSKGSVASPEVGDARVKFQIVKAGPVSVISQQMGSTLSAYQTKAGDKLDMLETGAVAAEVMFKNAHAANTMRTWIVRGVGFFMLFLGFSMLFKPLQVMGDVIPFIGSIIGAGGAMVALMLAGGLSFLTIALAWVFYRPLLAVPLLLLGVGGIVALVMRNRKAKLAQGTAAA